MTPIQIVAVGLRLLAVIWLGIVCIGVWTLAGAVPDAIYWLTFYIMSLGATYDIEIDQKAGFFATLAQLGIGAWLVFGAKGIAGWLSQDGAAGIAK